MENPGFEAPASNSQVREDDSDEEEESSTQADDDTQTSESTKTDDGAVDSGKSSKSSSTKSQSDDTSSAEDTTSGEESSSTESNVVEVSDVCNKGADFCFDMKVVQDDVLDNMAPENKSTSLEISAIESGSGTVSPAFGHRLRLGSSSFVRTVPDIEVSADSNFGIDIWFTPNFSTKESMILARVGDLMSIEVYKTGKVVCQIFAENPDNGTSIVFTGESTYLGTSPWRMVSCMLRNDGMEVWNLDTLVAVPPLKLHHQASMGVQIAIGSNATKNLKQISHSGFVGDIHLMRFWRDISSYEQALRSELRSLDLEPPN